MPATTSVLERQHRALVSRLMTMGPCRPGAVVVNRRKCGKPNCHCAHPHDRGHEVQYLWVARIKGKVVTKALRSPEEVQRVQQQIERYHEYLTLQENLIDVHVQLAELEAAPGSMEEGEWESLKKKLLMRSARTRERRSKH